MMEYNQQRVEPIKNTCYYIGNNHLECLLSCYYKAQLFRHCLPAVAVVSDYGFVVEIDLLLTIPNNNNNIRISTMLIIIVIIICKKVCTSKCHYEQQQQQCIYIFPYAHIGKCTTTGTLT
jgi:hypothetical protein